MTEGADVGKVICVMRIISAKKNDAQSTVSLVFKPHAASASRATS